jgi:hypothetical protein
VFSRRRDRLPGSAYGPPRVEQRKRFLNHASPEQALGVRE